MPADGWMEGGRERGTEAGSDRKRETARERTHQDQNLLLSFIDKVKVVEIFEVVPFLLGSGGTMHAFVMKQGLRIHLKSLRPRREIVY